MALPERVATVEKEILEALGTLKKKVAEFEELKAMMNNVSDAMRVGKVPAKKT